MSDDPDALTEDADLSRLLEHYQELAGDDREAWQDRVMAWGGAGPAELTRWHGALLAAAWIEQNTGLTPVLEAGEVPRCYRVTYAGRQALRRLHSRDD